MLCSGVAIVRLFFSAVGAVRTIVLFNASSAPLFLSQVKQSIQFVLFSIRLSQHLFILLSATVPQWLLILQFRADEIYLGSSHFTC